MKGRIIVSTLLALLLLVSMPMSALAATWDISKGDITVNAGSGGQTVRQGGGAAVPDSAPVITGTSKENNVTINADSGQTASVTLSGVNIDVRDKGKAAVSTTGEGNVSIELNGGSTLRSGYEHAGLEKNNGGSLTIADEDKNGKLTAWGGQQGAGIGGGSGKDGSNIFITGGGVNAIGGLAAAGIGGGIGGNGSNITISGGKVGATNGLNGAGIGGGQHGSGSNITISGGEVNAIGGKNALCDALVELFGEYSSDHFGWAKEIWDVSTIAYLVNPDWIPTVLEHSPLLTDDCHWAHDANRHFIRVATFARRTPIFRDLYRKLAGA